MSTGLRNLGILVDESDDGAVIHGGKASLAARSTVFMIIALPCHWPLPAPSPGKTSSFADVADNVDTSFPGVRLTACSNSASQSRGALREQRARHHH